MRAAKLHSPSLQKVLQPVGRETQGCGVGALAAIASVELAPKNLVDPHFGFGKIGLALCCADIVHDSKRRASGGCVASSGFLAQETASHWRGIGGHVHHRTDDPELQALADEAFQRDNEEFGEQQAQKAREDLRKAIDDSRSMLASAKHASIMNLRDKHLAHSLTETRREKKVGLLPAMKYGDERDVLNATLPIAEALYCWVNGTSFSFEDSRNIDRKNARALWEACTFKIMN